MMRQEPDADIQKLTPEAQAVLQAICAEHAASPWAADTIERLRPAFLCRAEQELALNELLMAGMLELRQKMWGEKLYQIPQQRFPGSCGASGLPVRRVLEKQMYRPSLLPARVWLPSCSGDCYLQRGRACR